MGPKYKERDGPDVGMEMGSGIGLEMRVRGWDGDVNEGMAMNGRRDGAGDVNGDVATDGDVVRDVDGDRDTSVGVALDNRERDKDVNEAVAADGDEDTRGDGAGDGDTNGDTAMDEDSTGDVDRNTSRDTNGDVATDVAGDVAGGFSPPTTSTLPHNLGQSAAPPYTTH